MMRLSLLRFVLAGGFGALMSSGAAAAPFVGGFDIGNATLPIEQGGPAKDGIPAIDRPRFVGAGQSGLRSTDRVLGIESSDVARAYPIRILNWHEVVNDRFGDREVIVTYCPLCGTGMAFETPALVAGGAGFGVSGLLYNSDVLLYDRATESLWSQILSTAITGPLKGTVLEPVPVVHTSWADWRRRHPATEVLSTDTGFERDYTRDPYAGYDRVQHLMFEVQHRDDRFPLKEWVLGVRINGSAKAYPFSVLERAVDPAGDMLDTLGGARLRIRYDREHRTAEAFDSDGRLLSSITAFWFAWVAFHPATEVLRTP